MRHQMHYNSEKVCFMQDATHAGLKLRNRWLKSFVPMVMGQKQVSAAHLKVLIQDVSKAIHGLVYSDICPDDRQNFKALQKCMNIRCIDALRNFVPDSEATVFFLQLCSEITSSVMDHDVVPQERIEKIFHAVYFLRIWKKWLTSSQYSKENFITDNAYMCVEVNASNLLSLIRRFRDQGKPELFLPSLFDSQACERAFRLFRSMGTVNFTKITFSLFELLHMARRQEVQNDIIYTKLPNVHIPKVEKPRTTTKIYILPSEEDIDRCLRRAKRFALNDAERFDIEVNADEIDICESAIPKRLTCVDEEECIDNENEYDGCDEDFLLHCDPDEGRESLDFPESTEISQDTKTAYLAMKDPKNPNEPTLLRKSTFVWHLTENTKKISSDRLIRVQDMPTKSTHFIEDLALGPKYIVTVSKRIKVGDWCFFKVRGSNLEDNFNGVICLGMVLSFRFSSGKTAKEKKYNGDIVNLRENPSLGNELEALSSWYSINQSARLVPVSASNHCFIRMESYIATVENPLVDPDTKTLFYCPDNFKIIDTAVSNIIMDQNA